MKIIFPPAGYQRHYCVPFNIYRLQAHQARLTLFEDKRRPKTHFVHKTTVFVYGCRSGLGKIASADIFLNETMMFVDSWGR